MMKPTNNRTRLITKSMAQFLIAVFLTATASCGKKESESKSWNPFAKKESNSESAFREFEQKFDHFAGEITGLNAQAEKTALWQTTSALLLVGIAFALIGGAALGSKARRALTTSVSPTNPTPTPTPISESADETIL